MSDQKTLTKLAVEILIRVCTVVIDRQVVNTKIGLCRMIAQESANEVHKMRSEGLWGNSNGLSVLQNEASMIFDNAVRQWPSFSGYAKYPVPSPEKTLDARQMYGKAWFEGSMYEGAYGELRRELAEHVVKVLTEGDTAPLCLPETATEIVIKACRKVVVGDLENNSISICSAILRETFSVFSDKRLEKDQRKRLAHKVALSVFREISKTWPRFSGELMYPVPSTDPSISARDAYSSNLLKNDLYAGEYGRARIELARYVFFKLEGESA